MQSYFLSRTAHICLCGGYLVILDLRGGDYLGLAMNDARALGRWVRDWPLEDSSADPDYHAPPRVLAQLLKRGVLTQEPESGKPAVPVSVTLQDVWYGDERLEPPPARWRDLWRFVRAVFLAASALRWLRLEQIVQRVRRRKAENERRIDAQQLFALMTLYGRLRPLLYARKEACLLHSLAVLEFLASYGIYPDWVFGVRGPPFLAHSWLQCDGRTLTDSPLKLDQFTPILVV